MHNVLFYSEKKKTLLKESYKGDGGMDRFTFTFILLTFTI